MTDNYKLIVKNVSPGPRGLHTTSGTLFLEPGQKRTLELTEAEAAGAESTGYFDISEPDPFDHDGDGGPGGSLPAVPVSLTGKNKAQLTEIAEAEGVRLPEGAAKVGIVTAIEAAREQTDKA